MGEAGHCLEVFITATTTLLRGLKLLSQEDMNVLILPDYKYEQLDTGLDMWFLIYAITLCLRII